MNIQIEYEKTRKAETLRRSLSIATTPRERQAAENALKSSSHVGNLTLPATFCCPIHGIRHRIQQSKRKFISAGTESYQRRSRKEIALTPRSEISGYGMGTAATDAERRESRRAALADVSLHSYVLIACGAAVLPQVSVAGKHCALSVAEENVAGV